MLLAGDQLQRMTAIDTVGIAPTAPIYQVVLTIASVEPLVSDLFSVTLTPAVPVYLARVGPTTPKSIDQYLLRSITPTRAAERPSSPANAQQGAISLGKPTCFRGKVQRLVRPSTHFSRISPTVWPLA
jgi:hypothetical protein